MEIGSDSETIVYSEAAKQRFLQMTSVNIYEIIKDRFLAGVSLDVIKNTLYSEAVSEDPIETVCQKLSLLRENNDTATLFSSVDNSAGISLLSFNSEAVVDTSIYSPFQINVNTNESINLQYGQVSYEQAVLSLPGKNGMDINLKIKYDTSRASQGYESADDVEFDNSNNPFMIGDGWYFDLPHIYKRGDVIYIPKKGNLCFNRVYMSLANAAIGGKPYGYQGQDIYHETCYYDGNEWCYIKLPKSLEGHANSGLYTFAGNYYYADSSKVLCETDRFENIILYQYSADNIFNKKLMSKIVDTNNRVINFVYNEVSDSKDTLTITIEGVTNSSVTVNFSKHVNEDANGETYYLVDSICNQEQETTYTLLFYATPTPRDRTRFAHISSQRKTNMLRYQ